MVVVVLASAVVVAVVIFVGVKVVYNGEKNEQLHSVLLPEIWTWQLEVDLNFTSL